MSTNREFFLSCWQNEVAATVALIRHLPTEALDYRPHPVNRSAREIVEHLLAHVVDLAIITREGQCDETLTFPVTDAAAAADQYQQLADAVTAAVSSTSEAAWESEPVALLIRGEPFITIPRTNMMWFFFFDIIHHRGQLSTHVRPMGGTVPAIYGFSADTLAAG